MRRFSRFSVCAAALGLTLCAARVRAGAPADAVRQLGSSDPAVRRRAEKLLLDAGPAALHALETAESSDAEVVNQIARLVEAIRYGLDSETPRAVVRLVNQFRYGDAAAAADAVEKLAEEGADGQRVLRAIAATTTTMERPKAVRGEDEDDDDDGGTPGKFSALVYQRLPSLAAAGRFDALEGLLRVAAAGGDDQQACDLAAFHLLRGTLDAQLAPAEAHLARFAGQKGTPLATTAARLLAYFLRAKDQVEKAREAAVQWGLDGLADGLAAELGRWQDMSEFRRDLAEHRDDPGALGRVAAYHRLLGNRKLFEALIARILACADKDADDVWPAAKVLILNRRAKDALDLMLRHGNCGTAVEMLVQRREFARAIEAAEKAKAAGGETSGSAEVWLASFTAQREGREAGRAAFAEVARKAAEGGDWEWLRFVVEQERKLGFTKEAIVHTAAALAVAWKKDRDKDKENEERVERWGQEAIQPCFNALFPTRGQEAEALWPFLRGEFPGEEGQIAVARLHELVTGKLAGPALDALLRNAEGFAAPLEAEPRAAFLDAIAEACARHGRPDQAIEWFEKRCKASPAAAPLTRIAELRAGQGRWDDAARVFGQAWVADRDNPAPLYLQGWALGKAGREAEGRAKRDLARLLPLGRAKARQDLAHALAAHGLRDEAAAEHALTLLVTPSTLQLAGDALTSAGDQAHGLKDYTRAALLFEREIFAVYEQGWYFLEDEQYLAFPARTQLSRAHARLAEGKVEQAMDEASLGLNVLPSCTDIPIALVPELEKAGRVKEADELFGRVYDVLDKACQTCPYSAATRNSLAWLAAKCRRRLDAALEHARRAVELEPDAAWIVDTLAEVHFQRGELDKAVEAAERAFKLDDRKTYRDQLERFRSARDRPKAP
ncbi:MAG: hypothetical protein FJ290_14725 [Planctomycetes bacterium]|nr:hypothetical protein [Planctomycetota bacterium]